MALSARDRQRMRRLAETLARGETDDEPTGATRETIIARIDVDRALAGRPPLREPWDVRPESGLVRRARTLGIGRIDR